MLKLEVFGLRDIIMPRDKAKTLKELEGTEVFIYPGDSNPKKGIVDEVTTQGVLFTITEGPSSEGYYVGTQRFIAFSANLSLRTLAE